MMTRRIVAALLAAAAVIPGVAAAQDRDHRDGRGHQRAEQNDRGDRTQQRPARADAPREARPQRRAERQPARQYQNRPRDQRQSVAVRQDSTRDGVRDRNTAGRPDHRRGQAQARALRDRNGVGRYDQRGQIANRDRRNDYRGRPNYASNDRRSWNNNWRNDRRYDWNRYRNYNRGAFHLPRYYAPYGWNGGYRRFSIGFRLAAPLFGQNYWIDDPYDYRLPAAYGPYRWVRYYGDAILVDVRSGNVVDVIHDIFW